MLVEGVDSAVREVEQWAPEMRVATRGGGFHVRWDEGESATVLGQLAFFAEFLEASGFSARCRWLSDGVHQPERAGSG